jgi:hypothetical protein
LRLLPMVGGMIAGIPLSLAVGARLPIRIPVSAGFVLMAVGLAIGATTTLDDGVAAMALWTALVGAGFGAALVGSQTVALNTLEPARAGSGSAVVQTMRQVGSVIGIAVLGAALNSVYRTTVDSAGLPAALADGVTANAATGMQIAGQVQSPELAHSVQSAFVDGMNVTLWICVGVAIVSALVAWLMPPVSGTPRPEVPEDPADHAAVGAESGGDVTGEIGSRSSGSGVGDRTVSRAAG